MVSTFLIIFLFVKKIQKPDAKSKMAASIVNVYEEIQRKAAPEVIQLLFMLNSAEHELSTALRR